MLDKYKWNSGSGSGIVTKSVLAVVIASVGAIMYAGFDDTIEMISHIGDDSVKIEKEAEKSIEEESKEAEKATENADTVVKDEEKLINT